MLGIILLLFLIPLLVWALPTWWHSRDWGALPSSGLGVAVIVVVVLLMLRVL